jgi:hypothetical protein
MCGRGVRASAAEFIALVVKDNPPCKAWAFEGRASSIDVYNNDVGKRFMTVKRHSNKRHPLFYFISFTTLCSPLTDIVIVHIVYINENIPPPPPLCDAVGGAFYYLVLRMQNPAGGRQ